MMKKFLKVFLVSFVLAFPFAGMLRTAYLTRTSVRYDSAHRMAETQTAEDSAGVSSPHNHPESAGG